MTNVERMIGETDALIRSTASLIRESEAMVLEARAARRTLLWLRSADRIKLAVVAFCAGWVSNLLWTAWHYQMMPK